MQRPNPCRAVVVVALIVVAVSNARAQGGTDERPAIDEERLEFALVFREDGFGNRNFHFANDNGCVRRTQGEHPEGLSFDRLIHIDESALKPLARTRKAGPGGALAR